MAEELTSAGLQIATLQETQEQILSQIRGTVDPVIGDDPATVIEAQEAAIYASDRRDAAEIVQVLFDALDPNNAEDRLLENLSALTGTSRLGAKKSTFLGARKVAVLVDAGKTLPAGAIFSQVDHPEVRAVTLDEADNSAGSLGAIFFVRAEAETTGPIAMVAGTMTVRVSQVDGWLTVVNPEDALIGSDVESDTSLRYRRAAELPGTGSANVNAIRADVLRIRAEDGSAPVIEAFVLENSTDTFDNKTGLPGHSIEVIIHDNDEADNALVAATIFSKAVGTNTRGSVAVVVVDDYGNAHTIRFSRVTPRRLYLELTYKRNAKTYVGDAAVRATLSTASQKGWPNTVGVPQRPGDMAAWSTYAAIAKDQPGVENITLVRMHLDSDAFASFTDLPIGYREIVTLSADDVTLLAP